MLFSCFSSYRHPEFFRQYLTTSEHVRRDSPSTISSILRAFMVYCETLRRDELRQIAAVGEEIIPTLANLWREHKNSDALKLEAMACFQFQFELHREFPDAAVVDKVSS